MSVIQSATKANPNKQTKTPKQKTTPQISSSEKWNVSETSETSSGLRQGLTRKHMHHPNHWWAVHGKGRQKWPGWQGTSTGQAKGQQAATAACPILPTPHRALSIPTFWRQPITAFAGAWSSTLRSLLCSFTFASLFALACSSAALSMGRMCRMGHWLPWLKYLRGKIAGVNATRIQLFLPLTSSAKLSTDTELMLRGVRSYKNQALRKSRPSLGNESSCYLVEKECYSHD